MGCGKVILMNKSSEQDMPSEDVNELSKDSIEPTAPTQFTLGRESRPSLTIDLMPSCKLEAPLSLTTIKIKEIFKFSMKRNGFHRLEETQSFLKVGLSPGFSFQTFLHCCFHMETKPPDTLAEFRIKINEKLCLKSIKIQGLCGNPFPISALIQDFSSRINKLLKSETNLHKHEAIPEDEEVNANTKNEINSYYEFCKILSSENYSLGKSISEFISNFNEVYKEAEVPDEAICLLRQEVEKTVKALFSDYNYGRSSAEKIMMYCRPAVEKYLFSKVGNTLMDIYQRQYAQEDRLFMERKDFDSLDIPEDFRIEFSQSVEQINRLSAFYSPGEKTNCLMGMIADAKSEVLEHSRGQLQLNGNLEPLIVAYILLKSDIQTPMAEVKFLQDWEADVNPTIDVVEDAFRIIIGSSGS